MGNCTDQLGLSTWSYIDHQLDSSSHDQLWSHISERVSERDEGDYG